VLTRKQAKIAFTPFKIAVAPVLLIIAGFDTISFGFYVALNALTPVWLQLPFKAHGIYGFNVTQNAACKSPSIPVSNWNSLHQSY
jgi:hypothetical protein